MRFVSKPYKVLLIDDDKDDYMLIKEYLTLLGKGDYTVDWAPNYDEGYAVLCKEEHNIYLIDHLLGAKTGLDLIREATAKGCKLPKILLTGRGDRELDIMALKAGADDYLSKIQLDTEMLERTIRHALQRYHQHLLYEQQQAKFKALFDQSIDPIYVTDEQWNFIEANNSFLKLFKLEGKALPGKKISEFFKKPEQYLDFITIANEKGYVQNYTVELAPDKSQTIIALISTSPIYNFEKKITAYQGIIHDITQLKKAEHELMIANQLSLTGRMSRMIAHEVRNPLTNITLAADQLLDNGEPEESDTQFYSEMIKRNSERINNLINDLLNSTKLAQPNFITFPVENLLDGALEFCSDRINLKGINVIKTGFDKKTQLLIDPEKLKLAFVNIITNAIEAMEETTAPRLSLQCAGTPDYFELIFTDNGKGMDEETQENLFKAFYTGRRGGMGLGMTTVQNIIISHKGEISVKSAPGQGASFTIRLPYNPACIRDEATSRSYSF